MIEQPLELHQFSHSHYNEKVRWTLDYKGISHLRICYLPGPHLPQIRRLSGQAETPVLKIDGRCVHGSARIIDLLEQRHPEPALYPSDPALRQDALSLQSKLDEELGPEVRRAFFETALDNARFITATFASEKPAWKQRVYELGFPLIRGVMRKQMDVTPETGRLSRERVGGLLDFLAEKSSATGFLTGDSFTIADLTAAALLGPVAQVDHPDMKQAEPRPARLEEMCAQWAAHPGMRWAQAIWRHYRSPRRGIVIA